jgi:predicted aspartyl protease
MIGVVTAQNELLISLRFRGTSGIFDMPMTIDTGFNDYLALTQDAIAALGLTEFEKVHFKTADGKHVISHYFVSEIEWFGSWMRVPVIRIEGGNFIGVAMLEGCRLTVEVKERGEVRIEKLSGN